MADLQKVKEVLGDEAESYIKWQKINTAQKNEKLAKEAAEKEAMANPAYVTADATCTKIWNETLERNRVKLGLPVRTAK